MGNDDASSWTPTLTTAQMAGFVADGVLRFDALVPAELNARVVDELPELLGSKLAPFFDTADVLDGPTTGTPLSRCHPDSALADVFALPELRGIVSSLVGPDPLFDHDFVHHLGPRHGHRQHLHPDAIVDTPEPAFDIQLFYFPHAVGAGEGGTRFVPGTHLRRVPSTSTARYQHVAGEQRFVGDAGTVLVFHHGLWHGGDMNPSDAQRWMYKIRLNPAVPQVKLWDTSDLDSVQGDPTDHIFATSRADSVAGILRRSHSWQSEDALRYDLVERAKLWRYLSDDPRFDVDHYLTRLDRPQPGEVAAEIDG